MSDENSGDRRIERRTVLRSIGVAGGTTSGLSLLGGATAKKSDVDVDEIAKQAEETKERRQSLRKNYDTPGKVRTALKRNAGDLITELVQQGFLNDAGLDALPTENVDLGKTELEPGDSFEGVGVTARLSSDVDTGVVLVSKHTETHHVAIYVHPEAGKAYSYVTPKSGGDATYLNATGGSVEVGTMESDCYINYVCADDFCHYDEGVICVTLYYREEKYQCCPEMGCGYIGETSCLDGCSCCNENCPP